MATVTLTEFKALTTGLRTRDDIKIRINYRLECTGWMCYVGWIVQITGTLDGQTLRDPYILTSIGGYGGQDGAVLIFTGKMPETALQGEVIFKLGRWGEQGVIARQPIVIANLDDITPPPAPEPECSEGATKCVGLNLYACSGGRWVLSKANATECGYTPEPPPPPIVCTSGQTKCSGKDLMICWNGQWVLSQANATSCGGVTPVPPIPTPTGCSKDADCPKGYACKAGKCVPTAASWLEKYKWWVIGGSVAIIIAAVVLLRRK